jgi:hypothetical protein
MKFLYFAQRLTLPGGEVSGPLEGPGGKSLDNIGSIISMALPVLIAVSAVILFLILVWGGIMIMISAGNPERIKSGKAKITSSIIGFIILVLSYLIVKFISNIFGLGQGLF